LFQGDAIGRSALWIESIISIDPGANPASICHGASVGQRSGHAARTRLPNELRKGPEGQTAFQQLVECSYLACDALPPDRRSRRKRREKPWVQ
jgi:hypothetical protein